MPAVEQVVHERVGRGLGLVGRVEVLRPVPPHVEVEARVAQRPPAAPAEVVDRLGAALGLRLVVGEVAGLVDRAREPDHGDLAASALADGDLARGRAGRARARPRRAPCRSSASPSGPSSPAASHAVTRRAHAGAKSGGVTRHIIARGPSRRRTWSRSGIGCGGFDVTPKLTRTGNPLHARNTARRAVKPAATRVLDNAAGPGNDSVVAPEPRPAPCSRWRFRGRLLRLDAGGDGPRPDDDRRRHWRCSTAA